VSVIELDREAGAAPEGDPGLPPGWRRRLRLALTAAVTATALAASGPVPAGLVEVATLDVTTMVTQHLAGGRLYAVQPAGGPKLVAYRLADGRRLWTAPVDVDPGTAGLDVVDGTVLVSSDRRYGSDGRTRAPRVVAVDAGTGRELWHSVLPRLPGADRPGAVLVAAYLDPDGSPGPSPYGAPVDPLTPPPLAVAALDLRTGRPAWTYRVPAGWWTAFPYDPSGGGPAERFVAVAPSGRASTVDLGTGTVRVATTIAVGTTRRLGGAVAGPMLVVRGDLLMVGYQQQGRATVTAYRTDALTPLWTATVGSLNVGFTRCGALLCLNDESGFRAVAPASGRVVWSVADAGWYGPVDRWLYEAPDPLQPGSAHLLDPATGRAVLDLGRWRLAEHARGQPPLFELVEADSGRIWLGLLAAGPRILPVGAATGLPQNSCGLADGYLACLTTTHQLRISRYRLDPAG
jgi:outer membrane protein assembly factor BamB